jgi:site-specific DNA-cytosine methylase
VAVRVAVRRWICPAGGTTTAWDQLLPLDRPAPQVAAGGLSGSGIGQVGLVDDGAPEAPVTPPPGRPPYRVPTLEEIRAVPWNGLTVASTFCGAGGSSTGYRMAGYRVLAAVEFVPAAADAYEANKADYTTLLRRDVRGLDASELLDACGLAAGELDVLDGSPPCEPFSTAGRRERTWNQIRDYSGQRQRTDDLFLEYARLVDGVRPRVFVAENVTGLARGRARGYFRRILAALRGSGYRVQARVLDAAWLGVPQHRERVIIIGVREDLDTDPAFPRPLPWQYTVRDAIGDLLGGGTARMGSFSAKDHPPDITDAPAPTVVASDDCYWSVDQVYTGHEFEEVRRPLDAPAATVCASASAGENADLVFRRDTGTGQPHTRRDRADTPSPTINSNPKEISHYEVEVRHDTGGNRSNGRRRRDRADEPAPAIVAGQGNAGTPSGHYQVEELRMVQPERPGWHKGRTIDLERNPAPTAMADGGFGGFPPDGYTVEYDQQTSGNDAFEPHFGTLDAAHPTVTAEGARTSGELRSSVTRHRRRFTIPELRRICGFPDDFVLTGGFSLQWERLGDAVPPPMAAAWARALADGPLADRRR